ncbi:MAG: hypothetical protein GY950_27710 [bacterium]|nr:hypothetical protein [bacterium]
MDKKCFIIMPFKHPFDIYCEKIYKPAVESMGYIATTAGDISGGTTAISDDISDQIQSSDIVLAELTGINGNVLYELGIAHTSAKPSILLSQSTDDVPFDIKHLRCFIYQTINPNWAESLKENIINAIKALTRN